MNDTKLMSSLQRSLGCALGRGSYIKYECIHDYDLVSIGDNTTVEGRLRPDDVSVGVATLGLIRIGSCCQLGRNCVVEMGSTIEDGVRVSPNSLVLRDSVLPTGSRWQGAPAIETAECDVGEACVPRSAEEHVARTSMDHFWFQATQYVTLFLISPFLSAALFVLAYLIGDMLLDTLGLIGFSLLIWFPAAVTSSLATLVAVLSKKALLGKVRSGRWPLFGSFHRRKYVVDHLIKAHMFVWREIGVLFGSPLDVSMFVQRIAWRALGGGLGRNSAFSRHLDWTGYELVQIGSFSLLGGGALCLPWSVKDGHLVGREIRCGDDVYVGTNSVVMGGVKLENGATVAAFSVATEDVAHNQTVVGTKVQNINVAPSTNRVCDFFALCAGSHIAGLLLWAFAGGMATMITLCLPHIVNGGWFAAEYVWLVLCLAGGAGTCLVLPLYCVLLCVVAKKLFIGEYRVTEFERSSRHAMWHWTDSLFLSMKDNVVRLTIGGTFLESWYYGLMGATIGNGVFLDTCLIFEPDLVHIGDDCCLIETCLSPHQITRTHIEWASLRIGDRCSTGTWSLMHGRDILDNDTTLSGLSMNIIGKRMTRNTWSGYPARMTKTVFQPKRPPLPTWYIFLLNPISGLIASVWWFVFVIHGLFFSPRLRFCKDDEGDSDARFPEHFVGDYQASKLPLKLRLDCGEFLRHLRTLRLRAGTFLQATHRFTGQAWCWWTGYELSFDSSLKEAEGRVSFGWWRVPKSIVFLRLRWDENDLVVGHCWYMGDPQEEIRFRRPN